MTFDREREVGVIHSAAIVHDANEPAAALFDCDVDAARAGVERILDEFFHSGRRSFDHLARCDAIDKNGVEAANGHDV